MNKNKLSIKKFTVSKLSNSQSSQLFGGSDAGGGTQTDKGIAKSSIICIFDKPASE